MANDLALYLFKQGTNYKAYEYLGAHRESKGVYTFRVWAPNADAVYIAGDFNGWQADIPMKNDGGVWSITLKGFPIGKGDRYKYIIERDGVRRFKADPYAFFSETMSNTASRLYNLEGFEWTDKGYMDYRAMKYTCLKDGEMPSVPMNIYEVHLGSWQRNADGGFLNYRELADRLSAYVKRMGYTHIELLPIMEHPFDASWGYQVCGYYAPTSRFGTPHDFMYFVNKMHSVGIGVILDWVPAYFPKDAHGLYEFDGGPLYEYQGEDRMEQKEWDTRCFDVARNEVQSFLVSNAMFWADKYHIDGLRATAITPMLHLDYGRNPGEWNPNPDGSSINVQSVHFFKKLGNEMKRFYPDVMLIAEENTNYPHITKKDGLCFDMKWNASWAPDTLKYIQYDPFYRKEIHENLKYSILCAFDERFILPLYHGELVHGKKSLIDKMAGDYYQKFACARAYLGYMMTHPGKKLTFMGSEFAQFKEWDFDDSLEWFMLGYDMHAKFQCYVADLNAFYLENPELWEQDSNWEGFRWIDEYRRDENVLLYDRVAKDGSALTVIINFAPVQRRYHIPLNGEGIYREVFSSDEVKYGGGGVTNKIPQRAVKQYGGYGIKIWVPPMGFTVIKKIEGNEKA
ncbi:MAG: 1,4-alpha-glucan branching protein GlgB [Clostridia bacterium]|nr:1,4-alpha-glucan branching protein GlgB [Clostridia bacterium]